MKPLLKLCIYWTCRFLLSLRYRFEIQGIDQIKRSKLPYKSGILFLPNHPAEIDPILLSTILWKRFELRPVVVEWVYHLPVIGSILRLMRGVEIPDFEESGSHFKRRKADTAFQTIIEGLRQKDNFLLYPAGRLKKSSLEIVGGASGTYKILKSYPKANVVLVRTIGLWGSSFSRAFNDPIDLAKVLKEAFWTVLKNGIFFVPKRRVIIEFAVQPEGFFLESFSREQLNSKLEDWYNRPVIHQGDYESHEGEPLVYVPYVFWNRQVHIPSPRKEKILFNPDQIPEDIHKHITEELAKMLKKMPSEIHQDQHLFKDLRLDSLDLQDILTFLDEYYDVRGLRPKDLTTVLSVMGYAAHLEEKKDTKEMITPAQKASMVWGKEALKDTEVTIEGETIFEAFLRNCDRAKKNIACADPYLGEMSYEKLKMITLILAKQIEEIPGEKIGILFPASTMVNILILASMMAHKIPVMINWTVGSAHLQYLSDVTHIKHVLTSKKIVAELKNTDLSPILDKCIYVEDLRRKVSFFQKLKGAYLAKKSYKELAEIYLFNDVDKTSTAVLLFTSGTENFPKGVPLSHDNILSNMRSAVMRVKPRLNDVILGFLPPFHSFGFTVTGILPLISGVKAYYYSNPMHYRHMSQIIHKWNITILVGAPSFLKGILSYGDSEKFRSLRLIISGAEKAPANLIELIHNLNPETDFLEGYGITECSPILTLNIPNEPHNGVGPPLDNTDICIIDPIKHTLVPLGTQGHILAKGPGIFSGYYDKHASPFVYVSGDIWYKTGDIGYLDERGYLTLVGRLKRLVKVGAEIVSLSALEGGLNKYFQERIVGQEKEGPLIAISALEIDDQRPQLYAFTAFEVTVEELNRVVKKIGFSNLYRLAKVIPIKNIPLMATGKINYRQLDDKLHQESA